MGKFKETMRLTALSLAVVSGLVVQAGTRIDSTDDGIEASGQALSVPPLQEQALQAQCDLGAQLVVTPVEAWAVMALRWQHSRWGMTAAGEHRYLAPSFYVLECDSPHRPVWRDA